MPDHESQDAAVVAARARLDAALCARIADPGDAEAQAELRAAEIAYDLALASARPQKP